MVRLSPIDKSNWMKVLKLRPREDQKGFVANNSVSLSQAYVFKECVPLAVYDEDEPVGFCMYAPDDSDGSIWILRLMIDERHQSRGFGRRAMELLLDRIKQDKSRHVVYLSFEPENARAKGLYESLGFMDDGRMIDGEAVYRMDI